MAQPSETNEIHYEQGLGSKQGRGKYKLRSGDKGAKVPAITQTPGKNEGKRGKRKNSSRVNQPESDDGTLTGTVIDAWPDNDNMEAGNQHAASRKAGKKRKGAKAAVSGEILKQARILTEGTRLPYPTLPCIRKGNMELSHVVTILKYLGEVSDMCPESLDDRLLADQIVQYCWDYLTEGRFALAGNAIDIPNTFGRFDQGRKAYVDTFIKERMPIWMTFFENCLKKTMDGEKYLLGEWRCYADIALWHILDVTNNCLPTAWNQADYMLRLKFYFHRIRSASPVLDFFMSSRYPVHGCVFDARYGSRLS